MPVSGRGKKKILVVAEAPGKNEDQEGTQLIGKAGQTLRSILKENDIELDRDCWKTNAVVCRPAKNKTPTTKQINCCRSNLIKTIKELKPEKIILLGATALKGFLADRMTKLGVTERWVGFSIPDQNYTCWVFPTYHPQYLNYNAKDVVLKNRFKAHIKNAVQHDKSFPIYSYKVKKITTAHNAIIFLESLLSLKGMIAIDFETTGKKPHRKGHKILTIAISAYQDEAVAFPIFYDNKKFMITLKKVLKNKDIYKIGQGIKYEDTWSKWILGYYISPWVHDTMLTAHVLDNRTGITGLKFQAYVNYGLLGYDKDVERYIDTGSKNANDFNKLEEVDLDSLLEYNAIDTIITRRLFFDQKLNKHTNKGNELFLQGQVELAKIEHNGIHVDLDYYIKQDKILFKKMKLLEKKILESDEVKKWPESDFNFNSHDQLSKLLFDILGFKSSIKTDGGKGSVGEEALKLINKPFTNMILDWKKLDKIRGTYLAGFIRETINGYMRPNYNLNLVRSHRSSSSKPNFQNIPNRNLYAQKVTRGGIIPRPGRQIGEFDYSGIEVSISACYHHDPVMIKYIKDPTTDMHRDMAIELFCRKKITKQERHITKNGFVFPQFYGDYYVQCATNIWKEMTDETRETIPFTTYKKFERHVQDVEYHFWNERFSVYEQWRKDVWKHYQKTGTVHSYTGFTYTGHMGRKEVTNYQIQGSAFHCLLWSLIQLNQYLIKNKFETLILGQIHDSVIMDIVPDEKEKLFPVIKRIICEDILSHWPWIIVPLKVDAEITGVDMPWNTKEEIEI
jgi:uracil-DNA glycosylase family 4